MRTGDPFSFLPWDLCVCDAQIDREPNKGGEKGKKNKRSVSHPLICAKEKRERNQMPVINKITLVQRLL